MIFAKRIITAILTVTLLLAVTVCVSAAGDAVTGPNGSYATLKDAVAASAAGDTLRLNQDMTENVTIRKNLTLDLNGHKITGTIAVADGFTLKLKDSSTDDFTSADGHGLIQTTGNAQAETGYIAIPENGGTSYHRLDLKIHTVSLRPGTAGMYFTGNYGGDEAIKAQVKTYGIVMSLSGTPTQKDIIADKSYSTHTAFPGSSWVTGTTGKANGTLLQGIMKAANTTEQNAQNSQLKIYTVAYAELKDGTYALGTPVSLSLREVVEAIDKQWSALHEAQMSGMRGMFQAYESVMENWSIPNLENSCECQVYVDYTQNSDGTVTATFSAEGRMALAMMELQLQLQLTDTAYAKHQILAPGSADANYTGDVFYFSLMSVEDLDITRRMDLFSITFTKNGSIDLQVVESIVSDGTFTDIKTVSVSGTTFN